MHKSMISLLGKLREDYCNSLLISVVFFVVFCMLLTSSSLHGQTAYEWLESIDKQLVYKSAEYTALMTVHLPDGRERYFRFSGKIVGDKYALLEYTDPPSQKGIRYLKRDDNLWIYFPRQDRTMQIQGHMLRQGVQGGDLSFEDMTESSAWRDKYKAEISSETDSTVTIQLEANDMTVSYPYRQVVVDKRTGLPIRTVNSGVGNHPIKEMIILESKRFGDRIYPVSTEIRSLLVENKWTRFDMEDIKFGMDFPDDTFTKATLER